MIEKIKIKKPKFLYGSMHGIEGRTALVTLEVQGRLEERELSRVRSYQTLAALNPSEPLFGIDPENWVSSLVLDTPETPGFGHTLAGIAVAIQRWARDPVAKALVLQESSDSINLAVPWYRTKVCDRALILALEWTRLRFSGKLTREQVTYFSKRFWEFLQSAHRNHLSPNTFRFAMSALERDLPVMSINERTIQIGWGTRQIRFEGSFTNRTSNMAARLARNKLATNRLLKRNKLPVPKASSAGTWERANKVAESLGWPVVIKPSALDQGIGVIAGITDVDLLRSAFKEISELREEPVIIEEHVEGDDHRMLVVNGRLLMTTRRIPAGVTGDGVSTIEELVEIANRNPLRGNSNRSIMRRLQLDELALICLRDAGLKQTDIPRDGQFVALRKTANISTGGTAVDVSDAVHPDNAAAAIRAARILGLDIAGVDFLCTDISRSYREVGGVICEVNSQPGFRPHWLGDPQRDINGEVLDILTEGLTARIPTAAITGTNGKSTTAKMLHRIWQTSGKVAGVCVTAGTWVGEDLIDRENLSGNPGAELLFRDPAVESAVIEMPRKGLIIFGQPSTAYDVAALLNIENDHIGVDGINTLEEMAHLKARVIQQATQAVVINADDKLCMDMRVYISAPRTILLSTNEHNEEVHRHRQTGGEAAYLKTVSKQRWLVYAHGASETLVMPIDEIPATDRGLIEHNTFNALAAMALALAQDLEVATVRRALGSFINSSDCNPGRYNYVEGFPFQLMVDFAHNADSASKVVEYVGKLPVRGRKILLCRQLGNRERADFAKMAPAFQRVFDEIIVTTNPKYAKKNPQYAGENPEENMLRFATQQLLAAGCPEETIATEVDLRRAAAIAFSKAKEGDFLLILSEFRIVTPFIEEFRATGTPAP
jgi:cyanophycin synthetase